MRHEHKGRPYEGLANKLFTHRVRRLIPADRLSRDRRNLISLRRGWTGPVEIRLGEKFTSASILEIGVSCDTSHFAKLEADVADVISAESSRLGQRGPALNFLRAKCE